MLLTGTASRLIALDRRQQFRQRIGDLLLAGELTCAGQGPTANLRMGASSNFATWTVWAFAYTAIPRVLGLPATTGCSGTSASEPSSKPGQARDHPGERAAPRSRMALALAAGAYRG